MPHGNTQCYLPPGKGDIPALWVCVYLFDICSVFIHVWIYAERSCGCIAKVDQAESGCRQRSVQSLAWSAE